MENERVVMMKDGELLKVQLIYVQPQIRTRLEERYQDRPKGRDMCKSEWGRAYFLYPKD